METLLALNSEITPRLIYGRVNIINQPEVLEYAPVDPEVDPPLPPESTVVQKELRGLLIPFADAAMVGFQPDANWSTEEGGYFTSSPRLVVLQRSPVEVYSLEGLTRRYQGQAVNSDGSLNQYISVAETQPQSFQIFSRTLLFFVNENNELLHDLPLRLDLGKGIGGAFASALRDFYFTCARTFFAVQNKPMQWLSTKALCHFVFACEVEETEGGFLVPATFTMVNGTNILNHYIAPDTATGLYISEYFSASTSFITEFDQQPPIDLLNQYGVLGL